MFATQSLPIIVHFSYQNFKPSDCGILYFISIFIYIILGYYIHSNIASLLCVHSYIRNISRKFARFFSVMDTIECNSNGASPQIPIVRFVFLILLHAKNLCFRFSYGRMLGLASLVDVRVIHTILFQMRFARTMTNFCSCSDCTFKAHKSAKFSQFTSKLMGHKNLVAIEN